MTSTIQWQQLSRAEAGKLAQVQADVRAERDHLGQQTRATVEERARRLGVERIRSLTLSDLRQIVLAKLFAAEPLSALERRAANEEIAHV